jgi:hypothetical protein
MGIEPVCCTKEMFDVVLTRNFMKSQAALRVSMLTSKYTQHPDIDQLDTQSSFLRYSFLREETES